MPSDAQNSRISHENIIYHICSFLDACGYRHSLQALQAESGVPFNVIRVDEDDGNESVSGTKRVRPPADPLPSPKGLEKAVLQGEWDTVLKVYVDRLLIPKEIKATLYELIVEEMLELYGLFHPARALLLSAPIFKYVQENSPVRYARLQNLLQRVENAPAMDLGAAEGSPSYARLKERFQERRASLLRELRELIRFLPSNSREPEREKIVQLFLQKQHEGGGGEGEGNKRMRVDGDPQNGDGGAGIISVELPYPINVPKRVAQTVSFGDDSAAVVCLPLPPSSPVREGDDSTAQMMEQRTAIGFTDGSLGFTDIYHGKSVKTPPHAKSAGVLTLALDEGGALASDEEGGINPHASAWLGVGYRDGSICVYDCATYQLFRKMEKKEERTPQLCGVTSLGFAGPEGAGELHGHHTLLVSGSFDGSLKLWDVLDGTCLQSVVDGHRSAAINALCSFAGDLMRRDDAVRHTGDIGDFGVLSAGNDGRLSCWCITPRSSKGSDSSRTAASRCNEMVQLGHAVTLHSLHSSFDGSETPTSVMRLESFRSQRLKTAGFGPSDLESERGKDAASQSCGVTMTEILVVTKSAKSMLLRACARPFDLERPIHTEVLCVIDSPSAVITASPQVFYAASQALPLLNLFIATEDGSISLYNVPMEWRHEDRWAARGGCMVLNRITDANAHFTMEAGKVVRDLRLCRLPWKEEKGNTGWAVLACASSLDKVYVLH